MVPLSRKERDRLLRQDDILRAAERVFAIKGYHKATIQDISKDAQYATGTIYLYFKDKEELYFTLIKKKVHTLISLVKEKVNQTEDVKEKIKVLIQEQLGFFEENQDFFRIYSSEKEALDKINGYLDFIAHLISKAQEQKIIRNDFDSKRIAYILFSMLNKESLKEMSGFILDIFLNGAGQRQ